MRGEEECTSHGGGGGGVVVHGRRLTTLLERGSCSSLLLCFPPLLLLRFLSLLFCLDVFFQIPASSGVSVIFFFLTLTVHSLLPLTIPLGLFSLPFGSFSLSSNPYSPSPIYGFPGFLSFSVRPLLSSVRSFLPLSRASIGWYL